MGAGSQTTAQFAEQVKVVREELSAQGREPDTFRIGKRVYVHVEDDAAAGRQRLEDALTRHYGGGAWSEHILTGPAEECTAGIRAVADALMSDRSSLAMPARLPLLCLLLRSSWLTLEGERHVGAARVLHRWGGRAVEGVSVGVAVGVPIAELASRRSRHLGAAPLGRTQQSGAATDDCRFV